MTDGDPTLFDAARAHARRTDPFTSDQALKAIAKNDTLMGLIWQAAVVHRAAGRDWNDTELLHWIERASCRRQQRNVIARSRGMLEDAGMIRQTGVKVYDGRPLMHYEIDPNNPKEHYRDGPAC